VYSSAQENPLVSGSPGAPPFPALTDPGRAVYWCCARRGRRRAGSVLGDTAHLSWRAGPRPPRWLSHRLYAGLVADLRCPLLCALNRRILVDEARHLAFGRLYGGPRLAVLEPQERLALDRWLEGFYAWLRSHGLYYGDSGIFLWCDCYRRLGGFRPIPVMEDYDLVQRMEAAGPTVCVQQPPLMTSSRRFHGRHPLAIFLGWVWIHLLFSLGVAPSRLARLYDNERRRQRPAPHRSL
jgi:hypothetical protein